MLQATKAKPTGNSSSRTLACSRPLIRAGSASTNKNVARSLISPQVTRNIKRIDPKRNQQNKTSRNILSMFDLLWGRIFYHTHLNTQLLGVCRLLLLFFQKLDCQDPLSDGHGYRPPYSTIIDQNMPMVYGGPGGIVPLISAITEK